MKKKNTGSIESNQGHRAKLLSSALLPAAPLEAPPQLPVSFAWLSLGLRCRCQRVGQLFLMFLLLLLLFLHLLLILWWLHLGLGICCSCLQIGQPVSVLLSRLLHSRLLLGRQILGRLLFPDVC